jgi:hypothetical protein
MSKGFELSSLCNSDVYNVHPRFVLAQTLVTMSWSLNCLLALFSQLGTCVITFRSLQLPLQRTQQAGTATLGSNSSTQQQQPLQDASLCMKS